MPWLSAPALKPGAAAANQPFHGRAARSNLHYDGFGLGGISASAIVDHQDNHAITRPV